jgi:hypothetical protein
MQLVEQLRDSADEEEAMQVDEDGGGGGGPSSGAGAAAAAERTIDLLESLASELGQWRAYFELDHRLRAWSERYERYGAVTGGGTTAERAELAGGARALLSEMVSRLLQGSWMSWLAHAGRALGGGEGGGGIGPMRVELTVTCAPPGDGPPGPDSCLPILKVRWLVRRGLVGRGLAGRGLVGVAGRVVAEASHLVDKCAA